MEKITETMIKVMRDIGTIGKDRKNTSQNFNFRGIDDVYNELHPIMAQHGLFSVPKVLSSRTEERSTSTGKTNIFRIIEVEFTFYNTDGNSLVAGPFMGEAQDMADKGFNKAHSIAHKYCLLQVFAIPTEAMEDPDASTPEPSVDPELVAFLTTVNNHKKRIGLVAYNNILGDTNLNTLEVARRSKLLMVLGKEPSAK